MLGLRERWRWWAGFCFVTAVALYLTFRAYQEGLPSVFLLPGADKVAHFWIAGLLAFFLDGALARRRVFTHVPLAALLVLVPTGLEEIAQRFSIHRTSSIWDYAADVVGVVVFLWLRNRRRGSA
jgi:VanZ family protein